MAKRRFNWMLAIVLLIALIVLAVTAFGLRRWQRSRMALTARQTGLRAYEQGDWPKAASDLGRYIIVKQNDVEILHKYAQSHLNIRPLKQNNIQKAISTYRIILRTDKNNTDAVEKLVNMYLQMDIAPEAELIAQRYLENNNDPLIQRLLAISQARQRKFDEASELLQNLIKEFPQEILAYETLVQLADRYPEYIPDTPKDLLDKAIKNNPDSALAYIIRASYHLKNADRKKALEDLHLAEGQELSDFYTCMRLTDEFINALEFEKARQQLDELTAQDNSNQTLWFAWAKFATAIRSKEEMLTVAEEGLKALAGEEWDFIAIAAELFIDGGDFQQATQCIEKLKQKNISLAKTAYLEGLIAEQKGQWVQAVNLWRKTIQLGNKSEKVHLKIAAALIQLGDQPSAIQQLRTLLIKNENSYDGHLFLAGLLAENAEWAQATEQARIALQIYPASVKAMLLYTKSRMHVLRQLSGRFGDMIYGEMYNDIEKDLARLEHANVDLLSIKLLQVQFDIQKRNYDDAHNRIIELKEKYPSQSSVLLAEVDLLLVKQQFDQAQIKLNEIINDFPESITPVKYLVALLIYLDKLQQSEDVVTEAIKRQENPDEQQELTFLLAEIYARMDMPEKACETIETLSEKMPSDIRTKRMLLAYCQKTNKETDLQGIVDEIKSVEGQQGWQWRYEQAKLWFNSERFEKYYEQIVSLLRENLLANPSNQATLELLAASYERAGELQLAISMYKDALSRSPDNIRLVTQAIATMYKAEEYDQADEILTYAQRQNLSNPDLSKLELQSYLRQGKLAPAGDILEEFLARDPENKKIGLSLALLRIRQNRFDQAEDLLKSLKRQDSDSLPITAALVELNIRRGTDEQAIQLCDDIVNRLKDSPAYVLRSRAYASLGDIARAKEDMGKALAIAPQKVEVLLQKNSLHRSVNEIDQAIDAIQKALELEPDNFQVNKQAIATYQASKREDLIKQSKNLLEKTIALKPNDIELQLYEVRMLLLKAPRFSDQVVDKLKKITSEHPRVEQPWIILATIYLSESDFGKTMDLTLRGLSYLPRSKSLMLIKARTEALRSPVLAIPTLKQLLEQNPEDPEIILYLANTYIAADQPQRAVELLQDHLSLCDSESSIETCNIAITYAVAIYKTGDRTLAEQKFQSLFDSVPDNPSVLLGYAKVLIEDQKFKTVEEVSVNWYNKHPNDNDVIIKIAENLANGESYTAKESAETLLRIVLKKDQQSVKAMLTLGVLMQTTSRPKSAAQIYEEILSIEPENVVVLNNLAWILCEEHHKYQQALELAKLGIKKTPQYSDLIDTKGMAHYRLGQYENAINDFKRCIKLYPKNSPAQVASYFHLARVLFDAGQNRQALENLEKAIESNAQYGGLSAADLTEAHQIKAKLSANPFSQQQL